MDNLKNLVQEKKESKDYYTIKNGLNTELECFEAIEALGQRKTTIKNEINRLLKNQTDPTDKKLQGLTLAAGELHQMQLQIINDVCERFEVIHPLMDEKFITPELLKLKQPYWDWYRACFKKYYGRPAPEVL